MKSVALLILLIVSSSLLHADLLRGQIRNSAAKDFVVDGATIDIENITRPDASGETLSDALGYFQFPDLEAGDALRLTLTREGFFTKTVALTFQSAEDFEDLEMTPVSMAALNDITFQLTGAVTKLPLGGVPVQLNRYDASGVVVDGRFGITDQKGLLRFRGMESGKYGVDVNSGASKRAKYESYVTPVADRFDINSSAIINGDLKPEGQDLKVKVVGYDFKTKEFNQPLNDVLVEVRGLNPADLSDQVLNPRADYTRGEENSSDPNDSPSTTTTPVIPIFRGEVAFTNLPPVAYEVRVSRLGYKTQRIIIEPGTNGATPGCLPYSETSPLQVTLAPETHFTRVNISAPELLPTQFDNNGNITQSGASLIGFSVRLVGLENTNTDGLSYQTSTGQTLQDGQVAAQFFESVMAGRYQVFVDGYVSQSVSERVFTDSNFFTTESISEAYDLRLVGKGMLEINPGSPAVAETTVEVKMPFVEITGRLTAADELDPGGSPIYQPLGGKVVRIRSLTRDNHLVTKTDVSVVADNDGFFRALVPPGGYGIQVEDKNGDTKNLVETYHGHEVVIHTGDAPNPRQANRQRIYSWPLVDPFPVLEGLGRSFANQRYALRGIPIHADREQHLELRLMRENTSLAVEFFDDSRINERLIVHEKDGPTIFHPISLLITSNATVELTGTGAPISAPLTPSPSNQNQVVSTWSELPPGDYTSLDESIDFYEIDDKSVNFRVIDWPAPGVTPSPELAAQFYENGLFGIGVPTLPLWRHQIGLSPFQPRQLNQTGFGHSANPITIKTWDPDIEDYVVTETVTNAGRFELSEPNIVYSGNVPIGGPVSFVYLTGGDDNGSYTVRVAPGGEVKIRGNDPTPKRDLPTTSYRLFLNAETTQEPRTPILNSAFKLSNDNSDILTGQTRPGVKVFPFVEPAPMNNFFLADGEPSQITENTANPLIEVKVGLSRGLQANVTLLDDGEPFAEATVYIRDLYGRTVSQQQTDVTGKAQFFALPKYADCFLTLEEPGYNPIRLRLDAANATDQANNPTQKEHNVTVSLTQLAKPTRNTTPSDPLIDRGGLFLPNVSRFGNVKVEDGIKDYNFFQAAGPLKATWKLHVTPAQLNIPLPDLFGTAEGSGTITGPDPIVSAYLIDDRTFVDEGFCGMAASLNIKDIDKPQVYADLISSLSQPALTGRFTNVVEHQIKTFTDEADSIILQSNGDYIVSGSINMWELPPGLFNPWIVVKTARGAYFAQQIYAGADVGDEVPRGDQLEGLRPPGWLANILDGLGIMNGAIESEKRVEEFFPSAKFLPRPEFDAKVELDTASGEKVSFVNYTYRLGLKEKIGQDSKASGLLGFGPGIIGVEIKGDGTIASKGRARETSMTLGAALGIKTDEETQKNILVTDKFKSRFKEATGADISPRVGVESSVTGAVALGKTFDVSLDYSSGVGGGVGLDFKLNNFAKPIPYAGPAIGFLGDTGLGVLSANVDGRLCMEQKFGIRTQLPRENANRTQERNQRVSLQDMFGKITPKAQTNYGFGYTTGLKFSSKICSPVDFAKCASLEGNVRFKLGTGKCANVETVTLTANTFGTWPVISRIKGKAEISADAKASAGWVNYSKKWTFAEIPFDVQFGTETIFRVVPYQEFARLGDSVTGYGGQYHPDSTQLFTHLAPRAATSHSGNAIIYAADDPNSTSDLIKFSRRVNDEWTTPIDLGSVERLGQLAVLEQTNGEVLVLYAQGVTTQSPNDPFNDAQIFSLTVSPTNTVSGPTYVTYLSGQPYEIQLVEGANSVGAFFEMPGLGQTQVFEQLFSAELVNGAWQPLAFEQSETVIPDWHAAVANDGEFLMVWLNEQGELRHKTRNSSLNIIGNTYGEAVTAVTHAGKTHIFAIENESQLKHFTSTGSVGFALEESYDFFRSITEMIARPVPSGTPSTIQLIAASATPLGSQLISMDVPVAAGFQFSGPTDLSENRSGIYSRLSFAETSTNTLVTAHFANGDTSELRQFHLAPDGSLEAISDGDALDDIAELKIVDADPDDNITRLTDIDGTGDFDGDTFTDAEEIAAGSDPVDGSSVPDSSGVTIDQWIADNFPDETDSDIIALDADPDRDTIPNLFEYVLALDPNSPDEAAFPVLDTTEHPLTNEIHLEVTFTVNPDVSDYTTFIEGAVGLQGFTDATSLFEEVSRTTAQDGARTITLRSLNPLSTLAQQFYRLRANPR